MSETSKSYPSGIPSVRTLRVDMESYLSKHDIVYRAPPTEGWEGFPFGNGSYGGMYWAGPEGLIFQANHTNALEDPDPEEKNEGWAVLRSCGRLNLRHPFPIHDWLYINRCYASHSLYRATAKTHIDTAFGTFESEFYVHAERPVAIMRYRTEYSGALAKSGAPITVDLERWGSRVFGWWYARQQGGASMDLGDATVSIGDNDLVLHARFRGVQVALRCRITGAAHQSRIVHDRQCQAEIEASPTQDITVYLACVTSRESDDPDASALHALDEAVALGTEALAEEHRKWWASYWNRSFLSISNDYYENLYYLHLYLMGSGSRGLYPPVFNGGIWTWNRDVRNWVNPHHWNQQQSFWCLPAANRSDMIHPYLDVHSRLMPEALGVTKECGYAGLRWSEQHDYAGRHMGLKAFSFTSQHTAAPQIALFYWWHYRFTGEKERFISQGWPFLVAVGDFYLDFIQWNEEADEYEIPIASTYEDERPFRFTNTVTNLSMAKRIFRILDEASEELAGEITVDDEKRKRRRHMLEHLPAYMINDRDMVRGPTLASGFVDGKELPERETHNHGPIFCPVFPAGEIGLADRGTELFSAAVNSIATYPTSVAAITPTVIVAARLGQAQLAERRLFNMVRILQHFCNGMFFNIDHWHNLSKRTQVDLKVWGDTHYWAARGYEIDDAATYQRDYLEDRSCRFEDVQVLPYEPDGVTAHRADTPPWPFSQMGMESLGNFAAGLQEMLLQSHEGGIRVFPAVPEGWNGAFTLLAAGGFLVTSRIEPHRQPEYVEVLSTRGGLCVLFIPWSTDSTVLVAEPESAAGPAVFDRKVVVNVGRRGLDTTIAFETQPDYAYLVLPNGADPPALIKIRGKQNTEPKKFLEAMLGKTGEW